MTEGDAETPAGLAQLLGTPAFTRIPAVLTGSFFCQSVQSTYIHDANLPMKKSSFGLKFNMGGWGVGNMGCEFTDLEFAF